MNRLKNRTSDERYHYYKVTSLGEAVIAAILTNYTAISQVAEINSLATRVSTVSVAAVTALDAYRRTFKMEEALVTTNEADLAEAGIIETTGREVMSQPQPSPQESM